MFHAAFFYVPILVHYTTGFSPFPSTILTKRNGNNYGTPSISSSSRNMFTGIVEEMGTVVDLVERDDMPLWDGTTGKGTELTVKGDIVLDGAYLGCSICVNGVCLTATDIHSDNKVFKVGLAPETLRRTYLGDLSAGDPLNLERASEIGGRNSGHFVQGHVDGVGTIIERWTDDDSMFFKVNIVDKDVLKYIVPKGFVAIDGTSLTVCEVNTSPEESWFTFMLVGYTQQKIIIPSKEVGGVLNIEVDVLGKYSESTLSMLVPRIEMLEEKIRELEEKLAKTEK